MDHTDREILSSREFLDKSEFWMKQYRKGLMYVNSQKEWKAFKQLKDQERIVTDLAVDGFVRNQEFSKHIPIVLRRIIRKHAGCVRLPAELGGSFVF